MKVIRITTSRGAVAGGSAGVSVKRGSEGQNWIRFIWIFLIGLSYFLLNMFPIHWYIKIILLIICIIISTWICFRSAKFQELIFGLKVKLEDSIKIQ